MTDEVPRNADDTALISDRDIEKLAEVKTRLEPTVAEMNRETAKVFATISVLLRINISVVSFGRGRSESGIKLIFSVM